MAGTLSAAAPQASNTSAVSLPIPRLTPKMKFAIKAALSLMLVYLIGFSQGWSSVSTAASTVMLIAAVGSLENAAMNGMLRVIGSIIGAVIGMSLIALFPQERFLYLLALSLTVTFIFHMARAYRGDMTVIMLTGITAMIVFQNGDVDKAFLYGIDKAFMTLFGIAVYTLVGILIWPVSGEKAEFKGAKALTEALYTCYRHRFDEETERSKLHTDAIEAQQRFEESLPHLSGTLENSFSPAQWRTLLEDFKTLGTIISLLPSQQETASFPNPVTYYLKELDNVQKEIETLFCAVVDRWECHDEITLPPACSLQVDTARTASLGQLQRATLSSFAKQTCLLHATLRRIASKLNALHRPEPTRFTESIQHTAAPLFAWLDPEYLKASLTTFLIFWAGVAFWVWFNPPGGFLIVALATSLSMITAFTPVKPSMLIIVLTLSFLVATAAYVLALPYLSGGFELALFLFLYGFAGFYFLPAQVSIFFLFGLLTMNINNQMYYGFDIFLLTLTMFYAFLSLLLLFYYIPFSTKPEHLFLRLKERFFRDADSLARYHEDLLDPQKDPSFASFPAFFLQRIGSTVEKMPLWATQIDTAYFHPNTKEALLQFTRACENLTTVLALMTVSTRKIQTNRLFQHYMQTHPEASVFALLSSSDTHLQERKKHISTTEIEKALTHFFATHSLSDYSKEEIVSFYETIALHKYFWRSYTACLESMHNLDFNVLKESRF